MMNRLFVLFVVLTTLLFAGPVLGQGQGPGDRQDVGELDEAETAALVFSREEEKLARDSYLSLDELWGQKVFANIAESEQRHMDAMKKMLDLYGTDDPIVNDARGVFTTSSGLTSVYQQQMARGDDSVLEAYQVGAYIEELDIRDLRLAIEGTDETPLLQAYNNLLAGSRNHLRAFVSHIAAAGVTYVAQLLEQEDVDEIVGDFANVPPPPNEGFTINANLSDAWYYPGTDGQGFFLAVFPDQRQVLLAWFTYDTVFPPTALEAEIGDPGQRWLTAQGTYAGAFAELQLFSSSGGLFDQSPPEPVHDMVGSILLQFHDCGSGSVTYDFPDVGSNGLSGVIPIERVSLDNVTHCQRNNQPTSD